MLSLVPKQTRLTKQIQLARTPDYCTTSNFTSNLSDCLSCANTYDIWDLYGDSVAEAAEACDLPAEPQPANATSSASASVSSEIGASATDVESTSISPSVAGTGAAGTGDPTPNDTAGVSETVSEAVASATATEAGDQPDGANAIGAKGILAGLGLMGILVI
jgi:hypothetical protein